MSKKETEAKARQIEPIISGTVGDLEMLVTSKFQLTMEQSVLIKALLLAYGQSLTSYLSEICDGDLESVVEYFLRLDIPHVASVALECALDWDGIEGCSTPFEMMEFICKTGDFDSPLSQPEREIITEACERAFALDIAGVRASVVRLAPFGWECGWVNTPKESGDHG